MKETGLLMQTEMIQAYMAGRKTETRRLRGLKKINENPDDWILFGESESIPHREKYFYFRNTKDESQLNIKSPWGVVGDQLWFREKYATPYPINRRVAYAADDYCGAVLDCDGRPSLMWHGFLNPTGCESLSKYGVKWRPSIHMFRWASRFTVPITGLRLERLQAIDEASAIAEGFQSQPRSPNTHHDFADDGHFAVDEFAGYFSDLHGRDIWDLSPWVWVIQWPRYQANG